MTRRGWPRRPSALLGRQGFPEELPDDFGGREVFFVPAVRSALHLVNLHILAGGGIAVGGVNHHPGAIGEGGESLHRHRGATVVGGDGADGQRHGDVSAPAAGVFIVALPHRHGVGIAVNLKEMHRLGEMPLIVHPFKSQSGHRGISFEQLRPGVGKLVAEVAAIAHSGHKHVGPTEIVLLADLIEQCLEKVLLILGHMPLRGIPHKPPLYAQVVGGAVGVADGEAIFVGYPVEVVEPAVLVAVAVGVYHQRRTLSDALRQIHTVGARGVAIDKRLLFGRLCGSRDAATYGKQCDQRDIPEYVHFQRAIQKPALKAGGSVVVQIAVSAVGLAAHSVAVGVLDVVAV